MRRPSRACGPRAAGGHAQGRRLGCGPVKRWVLVSSTLGVVVLVWGFVLLRPLQVLPRLGPAPTLRLTDQLGQPVTHAAMVGRIVVFDFIATREKGLAPVMTAQMRRLAASLRREGWLGASVRLVTITFDPERDTPQALRAYAAEQRAEPGEWLFLTGEPHAIREVIGGGFGVYYRQVPGQAGDVFSFTSRFVLVDAQGTMRAEYRGPTLDTLRVMDDIRRLRREASAGGLSRYAYEAAHLFLCAPR